MQRRLAQIDESIARYLSQLDSADRQGAVLKPPATKVWRFMQALAFMSHRTRSRQPTGITRSTSLSRRLINVRSGSRLCENSNVQLACRISVSISSMRKPIASVTSVGRRPLRKQFCASLARARFHTSSVICVVSTTSAVSPLYTL